VVSTLNICILITFYKFNEALSNSQWPFSQKEKKIILWCIWNQEGPHTAKLILRKDKDRGITFSNFKIHYKAKMNKTVWYYHRDRHIDQWSRIKSPEINLHIHEKLIFDKSAENTQWRKTSLFNKLHWENWISTYKIMKLVCFMICVKINTK
jgi:hypothetical protein